jgi:NADH dehydrogenase
LSDPTVVIVGAGFGGLRAAKRLSGAPVNVVLVDRRNFHTFSPLLYQVATAGLEPEEIAQPVRSILRAPNFRFRLAQVQNVDFEGSRLLTDGGAIEFDYLVLALGSVTNYFGLGDSGRFTLPQKDHEDATALPSRLQLGFERAAHEIDPDRQRAWMTAVVVGGGPTGVELSGALAELKSHILVRDYPELEVNALARVVLVEATGELLGGFAPSLRRSALEKLQALSVEVRLSSPVQEVSDAGVTLATGETIAAKTIAWVAGVRSATVTDSLSAEQGRAGRLPVQRTLQIPGRPNIFAIGDMALVEGREGGYPMLAPVAIQQGKLAAENILRLIAGRPLKDFHYRDLGTMATIGRRAAVAQIGPLRFTGAVAWLMWLTVHLFWLIGFRNRLLVLTNWAWNYFFYERGVRLITGSPK